MITYLAQHQKERYHRNGLSKSSSFGALVASSDVGAGRARFFLPWGRLSFKPVVSKPMSLGGVGKVIS